MTLTQKRERERAMEAKMGFQGKKSEADMTTLGEVTEQTRPRILLFGHGGKSETNIVAYSFPQADRSWIRKSDEDSPISIGLDVKDSEGPKTVMCKRDHSRMKSILAIIKADDDAIVVIVSPKKVMPEASDDAIVSTKKSHQIDSDGIEEREIQLVMDQSSVSREKAIASLHECDGDIVNAIMSLTI